MTINKEIQDKTMTLKLAGRLDTTTSPELEEELKSAIDEANEFIFDLEGLEYLSSAGLRILLASQKKMTEKGGMKVTNVNDVIMEIFEITGFSDILTIE